MNKPLDGIHEAVENVNRNLLLLTNYRNTQQLSDAIDDASDLMLDFETRIVQNIQIAVEVQDSLLGNCKANGKVK